MKHTWFTPWGWIYCPTSWQGWLITALTAMFCIHVFIIADAHSHSVSDTFYGVFPFVVPALGIWLWVASRTVKK